MPSTAVVAYHPGLTGLEPLSWGRISGLFSELFRLKVQNQGGTGEVSTETGVPGNEWREELSELSAQWREQEINMLFEPLSAIQTADFGETIKARLLSLRTMLQEEEGPAADLSPDSLRAFLAFLHHVPDVRQPNIALTSEGEVYARWKGVGGRLFAVHFISGDKVRFTAFRPNPRRPRLVQRVSGVDAADTVLQTANDACSVLEWLMP
jgi:hypothetical protein